MTAPLTALLIVHVIVAQAAPQPWAGSQAQPAAEDTKRFTISGLVYGDYYYVAANHRDELVDRNGFWLRRLYFTYDQPLTQAFSMRVRLEVNSEGDFVSTGVNTPYLKDAWLRWAHGSHAVVAGLASTPQIEFVEGFQGYRSIEKTPIDLYRWDSSRDLGLGLQGRVGGAGRTSYAVQFGNGSGTGSEVDRSKAVRGLIAHRFASGLALNGYADWQDRPDGRDISTVDAFAGWHDRAWRASVEYGWQKRRDAVEPSVDLDLQFLSAFGMVSVTSKLAVVGRVDRNFDPIPDGETIDYLPFAETARSVFGYAALDVTLAPTVHLIPNVEWTTYGRGTDGTTPGSDVVPRVTLHFSW